MNREELLALRQKIVESAQQLALQGNGTVVDRLRILVDILSTGGASTDVAAKAFELAQQLDDDDQKLEAYLDIIYGLDQSLVLSDQGDQAADSSQKSVPQESQTTPAAVSVPVSQESPEPIAQ